MKKLILFVLLFGILSFSSKGQVIDDSFVSTSLGTTALLDVYLPPGYDENPTLYYPVIYYLHGWGGDQNSASAVIDTAASLISNGIIDPVIIVCANNNTIPFNGSFYTNSIANGNYKTYNIDDVISYVETTYRAYPSRNYRSLMGQSMGGFGNFSLGILHKDLFRAIAAHGTPINFDFIVSNAISEILSENPNGPSYFFDYDNTGIFTKMTFAMSAAFTPNLNNSQTHINPNIAEFPVDNEGVLIDTIYDKWKPFDPASYISSLLPSDDLAILFGDGINDNLHLYPGNLAFTDTLEKYGLEYEFFIHGGQHAMPPAFRERALIFLDSIMLPAGELICDEPSNLLASAITQTTAQLAWTETGVATQWQIRLGTFGFDTTDVTPVLITTNPLSIDTLLPSTDYQWYIRAYCGQADSSLWVGPNSFNTACGIPEELEVTDISDVSAQLAWTETGVATQWQIRLGTFGFDTTDVTPVLITTNPLSIDTLLPSTDYQWYIRAYCGQADSSLWVGPNSFNTACGIPEELEVTDISDVSAQLAWTETGVATQWQIRLGTFGFDTTDVTPVLITTNPLSIDTLLPSTDYQWYIRAYCGQADSSLWVGPNSFNTACGIPEELEVTDISDVSAQLAWTETGVATQWQIRLGTFGFDTTDVTPVLITTNPLSIDTLLPSTDYQWYIRAYCGQADSSLWVGPNSFNTACGIPEELEVTDISDVSAQLAWTETGVATQWQIRLGTFGFDTTDVTPVLITTNPLSIDTLLPSTDYQWYIRAYCGQADSSLWVGPNSFNTACGIPEELEVTDISDVSAQLAWTETGVATQWQIRLGTFGFDTTDVTPVLITTNPLSIDTLLPSTDYQWYIRAYCGQADSSLWVGPNSFNTACGIPEELEVTDISDVSAQLAWTETGVATQWQIRLGTFGFDTTDVTPVLITTNPLSIDTLLPSTDYQWYIRAYCGQADSSLWVGPNSFNTACGIPEELEVTDISDVSAQLAWTETGVATQWQIRLGTFGFDTTDVTPVLITTNPLSIDTLLPSTDYQWYIRAYCGQADSSLWVGPNSFNTACGIPEELEVTDISDVSAQLAWTETGVATQWQIRLGTFGFDTTDVTPVLITTNPLSIDTLLPSTDYQWYIRAYCGQADSSLWVGPNSFNTACGIPEELEVTDISDVSAQLAWTETGVATQWQIRLGTFGFDTTDVTPVLITTNPLSIDTLLPSTDYQWYIRAYCGQADSSLWVGPNSFNTACGIPEELEVTDISDVSAQLAWTETGVATQWQIRLGTFGFDTTDVTPVLITTNPLSIDTLLPSTDYQWYIRAYCGQADSSLWVGPNSFNTACGIPEELEVTDISDVSAQLAWTETGVATQWQIRLGTFGFDTTDVTPVLITTNPLSIDTLLPSTDYQWYIRAYCGQADSSLWVGPNSFNTACGIPEELEVTDISDVSAQLAWTETGVATQWQIRLGTFGFDTTDVTPVLITTNPLSIDTLLPSTDYQWYIRAYCGQADSSLWVGPNSFNTACGIPEELEVTDISDVSAQLAWTETGVATQWQIRLGTFGFDTTDVTPVLITTNPLSIDTLLPSTDYQWYIRAYCGQADSSLWVGPNSFNTACGIPEELEVTDISDVSAQLAWTETGVATQWQIRLGTFGFDTTDVTPVLITTNPLSIDTLLPSTDYQWYIRAYCGQADSSLWVGPNSFNTACGIPEELEVTDISDVSAQLAWTETGVATQWQIRLGTFGFDTTDVTPVLITTNPLSIDTLLPSTDYQWYIRAYCGQADSSLWVGPNSFNTACGIPEELEVTDISDVSAQLAWTETGVATQWQIRLGTFGFDTTDVTPVLITTNPLSIDTLLPSTDYQWYIRAYCGQADSSLWVGPNSFNTACGIPEELEVTDISDVSAQLAWTETGVATQWQIRLGTFGFDTTDVTPVLITTNPLSIDTLLPSTDYQWYIRAYCGQADSSLWVGPNSFNTACGIPEELEVTDISDVSAQLAWTETGVATQWQIRLGTFGFDTTDVTPVLITTNPLSIDTLLPSTDYQWYIRAYCGQADSSLWVGPNSFNTACGIPEELEVTDISDVSAQLAWTETGVATQWQIRLGTFGFDTTDVTPVLITTNPLSIDTLLPSTDYQWYIRAYCGQADSSLWVGPNSFNTACGIPEELEVTDISDVSAQLAWTETGVATQWQIRLGTFGFDTTDVTPVLITTNPLSIDTLLPSTDYQWYIRAYCGQADSSLWVGPNSFNTACGIPEELEVTDISDVSAQLAWTETGVATQWQIRLGTFGFDTTDVTPVLITTNPLSIDTLLPSTDYQWYIRAYCGQADSSLWVGPNSFNTACGIPEELEVTDISDVSAQLAWTETGVATQWQIRLGTFGFDTTDVTPVLITTNPLSIDTLLPSTDYQWYIRAYCGQADSSLWVGPNSFNTACGIPEELEVTDISDVSAQLAWTETGVATQWQIRLGTFGFDTTDVTPVLITTNPLSIDTLLPSTDYQWYIRAYCGQADSSLWVGPNSFNTACGIPEELEVTDISDVSAQLAWTETGVATQWQIRLGTFGFDTTDVTPVLITTNPLSIDTLLPSTDYQWYIRAYCGQADSSLWVGPNSFNTACGIPEELEVTDISDVSAQLAWTETGVATQWQIRLGTFGFDTTDVTPVLITTNPLSIDTLLPSTDYQWYIRAYCGQADSSLWVGPNSFNTACGIPEELEVTDISDVSAQLAWTETGVATQWQIRLGTFGFDTTDVTPVLITTNPLSIDTLLPSTDYQWYIRAYCGQADSSLWVGPNSFNTACGIPEELEVTDISDVSAQLAWTETGVATQWQIRLGTFGFDTTDVTPVLITTNPLSIDTLLPSTDYQWYIRAYCGQADSSLWVGPNSFNTACGIPEELEVTDISDVSAQLAWTETGVATQWQIRLGTFGFDTTDVTPVLITTNPLSIDTLLPSTDYQWYIRAYCGQADSSLWVGPNSFNTACGIPEELEVTDISDVSAQLAWTETGVATQWQIRLGTFGFDTTDVTPVLITTNPLSIDTLLPSTDYQWYIRAYCGQADSSLWVGPNSFNTACGIPEELEVTDISDVSAQLAWTETGVATQWQIRLGTFGFDTTDVTPVLITTNPLSIDTLLPSTDYQWYIRAYCGQADSSLWVGPNSFNTACGIPEELEVTDISDVSAQLAWTETGVATQWQIRLGTFGFDTTDVTPVLITTNPLSIDTLLPSTDYQWYIRAYCGQADSSLWVGPNSFNTACGIPEELEVTDISDVSAQLAWTETGVATQWQIRLGTFGFDTTDVTPVLITTNPLSIDTLLPSTDYQWYIRAYCGQADSSLWVGPNSFNTACGIPEELEVTDISDVSAQLAWTETGVATQWQIRLGTFGFDTTDVTPVLITTNPLSIDTLLPSTDYQWYIRAYCGQADSSLWVGPNSFNTACGIPEELEVTDISDVSAQLAWTETGVATQWQIRLGTFGFDTTDVTPVLITTNPLSIDTLLPSTDYQWYIRAYCGQADSSLWVGPNSFNTLLETEIVYIWSGSISSDWDSPVNWEGGVVPAYFSQVSIPSNTPNFWPTYNGNFTIGLECQNITLETGSELTISGDLIINPGHSLINNGSGKVRVGGDWKNSGVFVPGTGEVIFIGPTDGHIPAGFLPAQEVQNYSVTTFPATMSEIVGGNLGPTGDNDHFDILIGFNFVFTGNEYTQLRINTNGWVSLNLSGTGAESADNSKLFSTDDPNKVISGWWDDLLADESSSISYQTSGVAPNRILTVEWKNMLTYATSASTRISFQIKLYETTNEIVLCYGTLASGTQNTSEGASIGINGAIGGSGDFIEATTGSRNTIITNLISAADWPEVNYKFTPPPQTVTFNKVTLDVNSKLFIETDVKFNVQEP